MEYPMKENWAMSSEICWRGKISKCKAAPRNTINTRKLVPKVRKAVLEIACIKSNSNYFSPLKKIWQENLTTEDYPLIFWQPKKSTRVKPTFT